MGVVVVDASALSAVFFGEPAAREVVPQLQGHTLVAPSLLIYELGDTCCKKCRRHPEFAAQLRQAFASLTEFDLQLQEVEPVGVQALAEVSDLTYYDAAYLWLARRLRTRLLTLDRRLAGAITGSAR